MLKAPLAILCAGWMLFCVGLPVAGLKLAADRRQCWWPPLLRGLEAHTDCIDALPARLDWLWVALAAGLGLYLELVVFRFHASCFQLFAFFKNFSLLSCFLGLGIGYALGAARPLYTPLVLPMLAAQLGLLHVLRFTGVGDMLRNPVAEHLALGL